MEYTIAIGGIATAFNIIIIYYKFTHSHIKSAILDMGILVILSWLFMGTITGLSIGMIASFIFSIWLLIFPPKEPVVKKEYDDEFELLLKSMQP